jgi:Ca-activated chloride channel family protein
MRFEQPYWLIAGLAACLFLVWVYHRFNRRQQKSLERFVSHRLVEKLTASVSPLRRRLKQGLIVAGIACLFVALARPQAGFRWEEVHRKGVEILVAVDTSKSMLTQDVKPNRLARAKLAVDDLVGNLNGDGVGLLAFAGDSFLQCPVTLDYDAFRESLDSLDTSTIPRGGTDIGGAIREAQAVLDARPGSDKILVLITDGEDLGGDAVAAAGAAGKDGVKIFTVGVGTAAGELIPVPSDNGGTDFVKDASGQFVKSRLDAGTLQQIAQATGGMYQPLGQQGQGLTTIYEKGLAPFTRHDLDSRRTKVYREQFQWPLLAGLVCFCSELLIGTRRRGARTIAVERGPSPVRPVGPAIARSPVVAAAVLVLLLLPAMGFASPNGAESDYKKGDYTAAEKEYSAAAADQPKQPELQFNAGSAAYKARDYAKAAAAFEETLKSTDVPLQQSAYYNLGNTQFRIGQEAEKTKPDDAIKTWQQAVKSYDAALQIKPDDADAKFNRDLVQQKLQQLQQQQQQQQQQQKQQDQQKQDQKKEGGQSQQSQSQPQGKDADKGQPSKDQKGQAGKQDPSSAKSDSGTPSKEQPQPVQKPGENGQPQQPQAQPKNEEPKPGQSAAGQQQQPKPGGEQPKNPATGQPQNPQPGSDDTARSEPGQMTKEEAKQLLDSVKQDEHSLPAAPATRGPVKPQDDQPVKDW